MTVKTRTSRPLTQGKELQVFDLAPTAAGSLTEIFSIDAESVLISLYVGSTSGDLDVTVYTVGKDDEETKIISFPTISAPTTELLLRKAASALQRIKVTVTFTDACEFNIRARGVQAEGASVKIEGASVFQVTQSDVTTTPGLLIPAGLSDRSGILIVNLDNINDMYIGGTLAEATTANGLPVFPGGSLAIDLAAGQSVYAVSDAGTIDVRIGETGAS